MFQRRTTGSVVCPSCGSLVGVRDEKCYVCGRVNPGLWGFGPVLRQLGVDAPFIPIVIGGSTTVYVLMLLVSGRAVRMDGLFSMLAPSSTVLILFGASGAYPVFGLGRWWTVLSAGWLHAGLLHILFNMYYVRFLGPVLVDLIGPARTMIVYTVGGIVGFLLSSLAGAYLGWMPLPVLRGAAFTVGASAPICGLLGAMLHYGRTSSSIVRQQATSYIVMLLVFGLLMPGIDNYAHLGGFLGGYATSWVMNPMQRERGDHLLIAAGCLAVTALSLVASVVSGLRLIG